ncbi:MAG: hypothetical protein JWO95_2190 [Verrucomicrobiales bacterium]|nr:hypothetical protein [Verrucomicrobiales bacterium]
MKTQKKRGWIFGGATALVLIAITALLTTTHAQSDAPAPVTADATVSTNLAPAELPKLPADLSPGLADVIKLTQSNVGDDVVVGYIKNSSNISQPTADEILYLNDLGVSQDVINALMKNGKAGDGNNASAVASVPAMQPQQIPTPPSNATLSSPEVPTYSVTQDAQLGAPTAPPDVPPQATTTVVEQTPPPEVTVNYFYDQLSPYGSWVEVEGYGRCWRPSVAVVNTGWRPYCDNGYWVNTDSGWYWRSYYSWGWAAFHYGRWCSTPRFGWCWVPDCTWGPAWVAWRQHDRYCGWAPLPPYAGWRPGVGIVWAGGHGGHGGRVDWGFGLSIGAFTFVGYDHFTDHHPWRHQPSHNERVNIYNHSTVINNTVIVNNRTIINNGISKDRITQVTHKPVQTVVLRDTSSPRDHGRMDHVGSKPALAVYRPSPTVIAKTVVTPATHNKPVLINTTTRVATRTEINHSPRSTPFATPKANNHDSLSTPRSTPSRPSPATTTPADHQSWPGQNLNHPSTPRASTIPDRSSSPNPTHSFAPTTPSREPVVRSTPPASAPNKTVEQPSNYYGSGGYHNSSAAPSHPTGSAGRATAPSYSPGPSASPAASGGHNSGAGHSPASGGAASGAGHGIGGAIRADRPDGGRGH